MGRRFVCSRAALLATLFLIFASGVSAQPLIDPQRVEFNPSIDHNALSGGTPLVQSYRLDIYVAGQSTIFESASLGKPNPETDGMIRVAFLPLLPTPLVPGVVYESRVTAIGPWGSASSTLSNTFALAACAPSLSPTSQSSLSGGTTGSVTVTAGTGCAWSAVSNASWITVTSGASGSGNGSVGYSVAANTTTTSRTGTVTIGGQTFTVTQAGVPCSHTIAPMSQSAVAGGTSGTVTVTAGTGCAWTAVSNASWITVTSGASGSGNGSVGYSVAANTTTASRTGTVTIGGQTFTVTQAGVPCSYTIAPTSQSVVAGGASGTVTVTAGTGCAWTAVSNASWITVTSGASGTGNGSVGYSVAANTTTAARTGTVTIGGQTFTVTQAGVPCSYTIAPMSQSAGAGGTSGTVTVTAGTGCAWSAVSNASWITVTSGASGTGNGSVGYSVAANTTTASRTGTVTIGGQTFTVTQAGVPCSHTIAPTSQSVVAGGTSGTVTVTAGTGCAWTAVSNASWITVTSGASGSGNGSVGYSVPANTTTAARTGTVTIGGQTFTVTQAGVPCSYTIAPTSQSVVAGGTSGTVTVTAGTGCAWTAVSNASWITVTSGASGSGNGSVGYSVAANTTTAARTGTVTIGGQTFTVTQAGVPCSHTIAPTSQSVVAGGTSGTVTVTALAGCAWSAVSNASWITVTSGASGSGNGSVGYSVAANTTTAARTGTVTIGGQTFTVTQAGVPCSYTIAPTSQSVVAGGTSGTVTVTALAGCAWTAVSNASWITVTSGASGSGNGSVGYSVAANTTTASRTGTVAIGGQTFTVTQAGVPCSYTIAPTSQSVVAGGTSGTVTVTAGTGCAWTAVSNASWITVTSGASGTGNGSVGYSVAANTTTAARTGTVAIGGQTFTVTQAGVPCSHTIAPTSQSVVAGGTSGTVTVTAGTGCAWTAVSNASWITVTSGASGSGNGSVGYSVAANTTTASRTGTVAIGGQTFTVTQAGVPCSHTIAPTSQSVVAGGTSGTVTVTALAGCAWSAVSNASWITVTSGASGTGNGSVGYSVAANTTTAARTGTVTIGGQTFTVTQAGVPCSYTIAPTSQSVVAGGTSGTVTVTAGTGCAWSAVSNASWITVTSGASGSGNGSVGYSVAANTTTAARTGTVTIGGQTFTVTQAGVPCSYTIAPTSQSVVAGGTSGTVTVTAGTGCAWTAVSNASWITVTSGASGSGNGSVGYSVAANTTTAARTGTVTIGGQTFTVTQAGVPCSYTIAPTSQSVVAGGTSGTVTVTALAGCAWSAVSNASWITVTSGASGSGNGSVGYSVAANTTTASRTGTVTIGGQTFTVTQAGVPCSHTIAPMSQSAVAGGTSGTVTVTAGTGCAWTAVSNASWITVTSGASGTGNGSVGYTVAANATSSSRTGTVSIGGQTFTVMQGGVVCSFSISPTSQSVAGSGATGSVAMTSPTGCVWTVLSNATWITITSGVIGNGNGTVGYSVGVNGTGSTRTGTMTIGGQTFTVTQAAGSGCGPTLSPLSQLVTAAGATGTVAVSALAGCAWTAVSNATWITVTSGASGSGNGSVGYSVAANTTVTSRTGTITIGGQTFTLAQGGVVCTFSISPATQSVGSGSATGTVSVTAPTGCVWTVLSNATWITHSAGVIQNGNRSIGYSVAANATAATRTGTMTIAGQTFTVTQAAFMSALTSPVDGATSADTGWPFTWTATAGALANRLTVGTAAGSADLLDTGEIQATAYTAANLPGGQTLHARIWTKRTPTNWSYSDTSFTTAGRASFTYPTHNATGVDTTLPFTWSSVPGAIAYAVNIGTTVGAKDLVDGGETQSTSYLAATLPLGQTLYARIWTKFTARWDFADITFTTAGHATFLYPTNHLSNVNTTQPFTWTTAAAALGYRVTIGSSAGASNLADSGEITGTEVVAPALPTNQWLFARIATHFASGWQWQDIRFMTTRAAYLLTPAAGAVVGVACTAIRWTPVADARAYTLNLGTTAGATDLVDTGEVPYTTLMAPTLPANQPIFARIWTKFASDWTYSDVQFSTGLATITSPPNNATGIGTSGTFQWSAVAGASAYRLYVGDTPGANNRINSGDLTQTSYPMTGLPIGVQLYAQIWTKTNGCWVAASVVAFRP